MTFLKDGVVMRAIRTPNCFYCGKPSTIFMPDRAYGLWAIGGQSIQYAWPEGSENEREMLLNGTHPDCWDEIMKVGCKHCSWTGKVELYDAHLDVCDGSPGEFDD